MTKKMITAFIGSLGGGGAQGVFVTVMNYYIQLGYEIRVVVFTLSNDVHSDDLDERIIIECLHANSAKDALPKIFEYVKKKDIEIAFAFSPEIAVDLIIAKKILKKSFIILGRCINTLSYEYTYADGFFRKYLSKFFVKLFYHEVNIAVAQAEKMKKDLVDNFGFSLGQVVTINNPLGKKYTTKITPNLSVERENIILYVGRFEHQKGLLMLLEAYSKLKCDSKLILIGEGSQLKAIQAKTRELHIEDSVEILPFKKDIENYYKKARITVMSSFFEGFPNVLSESIACGTPVVAFDLPSGPSDIICDGVNGYLVKYLDVDDLSE